jgi:hypothetical protein
VVVRLLEESQRDQVSPVLWAEGEARRLSEEPHHLWLGRAQAIAEFTWKQMVDGSFSP